MNKRVEAIEALQRRLGHDFADPALLERALTHPSAGDGARAVEHYQVLEFLGDRVLGLLAAEALLAAGPHWREGELSRRQVALVSGPSCAKVARSLDLGPALRLAGYQQPRGRSGERPHPGRRHGGGGGGGLSRRRAGGGQEALLRPGPGKSSLIGRLPPTRSTARPASTNGPWPRGCRHRSTA